MSLRIEMNTFKRSYGRDQLATRNVIIVQTREKLACPARRDMSTQKKKETLTLPALFRPPLLRRGQFERRSHSPRRLWQEASHFALLGRSESLTRLPRGGPVSEDILQIDTEYNATGAKKGDCLASGRVFMSLSEDRGKSHFAKLISDHNPGIPRNSISGEAKVPRPRYFLG